MPSVRAEGGGQWNEIRLIVPSAGHFSLNCPVSFQALSRRFGRIGLILTRLNQTRI